MNSASSCGRLGHRKFPQTRTSEPAHRLRNCVRTGNYRTCISVLYYKTLLAAEEGYHTHYIHSIRPGNLFPSHLVVSNPLLDYPKESLFEIVVLVIMFSRKVVRNDCRAYYSVEHGPYFY